MKTKRGQVSIDFLLALIVALVFFTWLSAYSIGIEATVSQPQGGSAKTILLDYYSTIASVKAFGISVENYGAGILEDCEITITQDSITVTRESQPEVFAGINLSGITITNVTEGEVVDTTASPPIPIECGDRISIRSDAA